MSRHFVRRPLPLRLLAAGAVGASLSLVPHAGAQIGPATAEQSDAPEPRFGMFRQPSGYEGAERRDPIDYNGELLMAGDGRLTLSVWKGINGEEALERDAAAEGAEINRADAPIARGAESGTIDADASVDDGRGSGVAADGDRRSFGVTDRTRVYLNGERASYDDLRPGDRVRIRGVDLDGSGVDRIVALRTDDFPADTDLDIAPDIDSAGPTSIAPGDAPSGVDPATAARIKRAAETGVTSPDGGGFQNPETSLKGESKERVERRDRGVQFGGDAGPGGRATPGGQGAPADGKRAPGFGFVVSDSPGEGVLVADVQPGGPAADAGVKQGDFLTRMAGQSVQEPSDVKKLASKKTEGDGEPQPVPATVWRDGESMEVEIIPSESARDYYPRSTRGAMAGSARSGFDPQLQVRTRDSEDTGVEVLAAAATGALAAEAGEDSGTDYPAPGYGGYGGDPYGFYGSDFVDGIGPFDDGLYGAGYGYGTPATGYEYREERLENEILRRRMFEARANAASGLDREDYFSGSYPGPEGTRDDMLRDGDKIIGVNDNPISSRAELRRELANFRGDRLKLNVIRNGERENLYLPKRQAQLAVE